jgi:hypothetical protein
MQPLGIWIVKKMVKRLVILVWPPCQPDAQRQKQMLEELLLAS